MPVRLSLFGSPTIDIGSGPVSLPFERRSQLLVYLVLKRGWIGRAELATLFWPEQPQKLAFANLRKTLFRLQGVAWGRAIELQGQNARLDAQSDVAEFEAALRQGRTGEALPLYAGELLAGFDDAAGDAWTSWLGFERDRLQAAWRNAVLRDVDLDADPRAAADLSSRLLDTDPLDEAALRLQMEALSRTGQRGRARQSYRDFVSRLEQDLGIAPGAELQALHDSIAGSTVAAARPPASAPAGSDDGFVGRSLERRRLGELMSQADCRLVSLVGPGGMGKTRLARRAMIDLAAGFADGALFVALEDASGVAELGARLARAVGVERVGAGNPFERAIEALRKQQLLLVLDNFEQLADTAPEVEALLARCPSVRVLLTTRVRLGSASEWVFPLEGLPVPEVEDEDELEAFDAVRLFLRAARRVEPTFLPGAEPAAIADICRQVGGLPLALELAAAWTRVLSCEAIAAELRHGTELLRAVDPARPARQASIEVVFDHAWRLLGPSEREALGRASVFRGGFSAEAARAVGAPLAVLGALLDKSLLRKEADRFFLHPLLLRLAGERLGDGADRKAAEAAHGRFFHRLLLQMRLPVDDGDRDALRELDREFDNCRAAWRHPAQGGVATAVLAGSAVTVMKYCDHRGRFADGVALLGDALADPGTPEALRPLLRSMVASLLYRMDRYPEAIESAMAGLASAAAGGDHETRLQCFKVLGSCCYRLGRFADARRFYRKALAEAPAQSDPRNAAAMLDNLALVEKALGRFDESLRMSNESLVQLRRIGDVAGEALCLSNLSALQIEFDDLPAALASAHASLAICERHGLAATRGFVLANLTEITLRTGELAAARAHASGALEISLANGNRATETWVRLLMAQIAVRENDIAAARTAVRDALELGLAIERPLSLLAAIATFIDVLLAQGERRAAGRLLSFIAAHSMMTVEGRLQLKRRFDALAGAASAGNEPAWDGPDLEQLARRIVAETPSGHTALVASLNAAG